ncbi:phage minor capsid protein [Heyndrickxia coagulans]|uniref:phage minor capsid protein n=1 Tax=Heyndrickxia coagulans TaxID=1398 RepID=UPI0021F0F9A6|nr:phage minor capsid protein [Heyndrickxia coagulans]UYM81122.1 phage minor capsid protein [Heyndrickxia coagulans]
MLTPNQLEQLAKPLINIYGQLEIDIIKAIVKRLETKQDITKDNVLHWKFEKLRQLGDLNKDVIQLISLMTGKTEKELEKLIKESMKQSVQPMDNWLSGLADDGKIDKAPPLEQDTRIFNTLLTFQRQATSTLNLTNSTILQNSQQVYRDIISQSTVSVMTGMKTHQQAVADTAAKWAEKGIPALVDKKGRQWSIEGYIPMVVKSVANNVANQTQFDRMDSYGVDLIEISSHVGARPGCAPYQGRIFDRNGKSKKYPSLASTTYGKPAGIFGINCHHHPYPYIPGVSVKRYEPYPIEENAKAYEQSQQQRKMERDIRKAKNNLEVIRRLGTKEDVAAARKKVREKQANMRAFLNDTGRTRRYDREQIIKK